MNIQMVTLKLQLIPQELAYNINLVHLKGK
jgi:hypothetical protein